MTAHSNKDLFIRFVMGEATAEDRAHLRICSSCRIACDRDEAALTALRRSVREWSDDAFAATLPVIAKPAPQPSFGRTGIMAFLLLLALVGWKVALDDSSRPDPALFEYVQNDISRPVPSGLEPLLTLVSPVEESKRP